MLRFVLSLPRATRNGFFLAGVTFVGGSLGVEWVGSQVQAAHGCDGMIYITLASLEELLEMLGVILLIYALLCHLAWMRAELSVAFWGAAAQSPDAERWNYRPFPPRSPCFKG